MTPSETKLPILVINVGGKTREIALRLADKINKAILPVMASIPSGHVIINKGPIPDELPEPMRGGEYDVVVFVIGTDPGIIKGACGAIARDAKSEILRCAISEENAITPDQMREIVEVMRPTAAS
jgi:hypothetical protein